MSIKKIYLDYASTTPIAGEVKKDIKSVLDNDLFGNPSSLDHEYGSSVSEFIESSRTDVAELINADGDEIIWTSGATEANNLALIGFTEFKMKDRPLKIASSFIEHKSVIEPLMELKQKGHRVEFITPNHDGYLDPDIISRTLDNGIDLLSCMHINNEVGSTNDIALIGALCRDKGTVFHVDAAQSIGKLLLDVRENNIDLMSLSAHKVYGPKGVGALFVNHETVGRLKPLIFGGGQERGMRPGTLATHQIAGIASAFRLAKSSMQQDYLHLSKCREIFLESIKDLEGLKINGDSNNTYPGIISLCFPDLNADSLIFAMDDLAVSKGSACATDSDEPSHVLKSIGLSQEEINGTIRVSFGRETSYEDIETASSSLRAASEHLRLISGGTA